MKENFYISFKIENSVRLKALEKLLKRVNEEKTIYFETFVEPPSELEFWEEYLDQKTLNHFNQKNIHWDFDSILHTIINGEYEFLEIEKKDNISYLYYNPFSCPFGGTESIKAMIEGFGAEVLYDSWNDGLEKFENDIEENQIKSPKRNFFIQFKKRISKFATINKT
ncbi:hypothetical protein [Aureivirga sp. CE67]|uniref:hypothetical protein n=1 Tax=Aureivirga sp. CE67 TaxID=1788983 RepID=UPI0018C99EA9|nr:hypothetical protein [Aureivirga sp. CE67]